MRQFLLSVMALTLFGLSACSQNKNKEELKMNDKETKKTLIVYFSATGTTAEAAKRLAKTANADLYEIQPEKPYTDADLNWNDEKSRSSVEMNDPKSRPAIKGKLENAAQYDTIYVGFPIRWYTAPTIINTFVEQTDLKGKTLITFATSGGSTVAKASRDLKAAYPELRWKEGGLAKWPFTGRGREIGGKNEINDSFR